jgi:2-phosphosulfolactate phosphatase
MSRELHVHLLPTLFEPSELRGGVAVVIDVLRASTTIVHALAAGACAVVPCLTVDEARTFAANHPADELLLGGERGGKLIDGFDLDNSPQRYTQSTVRGKTIVFTSSNGTQALLRSGQADRVLIGAFVNLSTVVETLLSCDRPIHLVCAGTCGSLTAEDVLCAGAIAKRHREAGGDFDWTDDSTQLALDFFAAHSHDQAALLNAIRAGHGGRNLTTLGFEEDIRRAATCDLFRLVPEYSPHSGRIEIATN